MSSIVVVCFINIYSTSPIANFLVCSLPPEVHLPRVPTQSPYALYSWTLQYCEFGGIVKKCEEWLKDNHPDLFQRLYSEGMCPAAN